MRRTTLLLGFVLPMEPCRQVDRIEVNHVLAKDGSERLVQVILWDRNPFCCGRYCVRQWWHAPKSVTVRGGPGNWTLHTRYGTPIRSITVEETWTPCDPEVENHKLWQPQLRVPVLRE